MLLLVGLGPIVYVAMQIRRFGITEALSLRPIGVMFLWIGYHLSPWLYLLTGEQWDYFLLVPEHINLSLVFSTTCTVLFLAGYAYVFTDRVAGNRITSAGAEFINVSPALVALLALLVFALLLTLTGGIAELWSATTFRGEGQFDERVGIEKLWRIIAVMRVPVTVALIMASAFLILRSTYSQLNFWLGHLGLVVASLHGFYYFSRAAGFPLILVAFIALRLKGRRALVYALILTSLAVFLGSVGLNYRHWGGGLQGVGNFLVAAGYSLTQLPGPGGGQGASLVSMVNPLDSVAAFTRIVELDSNHRYALSMPFKLLWNLNPLPSELVPLFEIGEGLASAMGTWGNYDLTTPALAELWRVFGYWGSLGMLIVGMLCGWCEKRAVMQPSLLSLLNVLLFFAAFPVGLHSSLRPMTRPFVYGAALMLAARLRIR
jgi:hypothetical protein